MANGAAVHRHRVTAVLVTHNGAVWIPEVIAALTSQTRPIDRITAVDTGSHDASVKLLKAARITHVTSDVETGFGEAVSIAVDALPDPIDDEWIWLMHDDCAPAPTALAELLAAIDDRPQVVMVGPKLLGWHDRTHLLEAGISIAGNGARWTGLEALEYDQGQHDVNLDVLAVSTAGALIRRDVFEELEGLDPNLALFRDDVDFGWRARAAGHSVIVATKAVAFHAQASATERRVVEVKGAFLHRPLLLDRRNAAYVLLSNSSWWILPWLVVQILGSAVARAIGYLVAKLPGYAADEILAVGALVVKPGLIIKARKIRRGQRFVSPRVVAEFIPPRWSQLRLATEGLVDQLRSRILPEDKSPVLQSVLDSNEDEDLLTPASGNHWVEFFKRPQVIGFLLITLICLINSRNRLGALVGGALPTSPQGATDLWSTYFESWHQVGMGSSLATPTWIAVIATASLLTLGNVPLFISTFFLVAPIVMMATSYLLLKRLSQNPWICVPAAFLYAISPVAIAAVSTGHIATLLIMILAPYVVLLLRDIEEIELFTWRKIFGASLLLGLLYGFSLMVFVVGLAGGIFASLRDYERNAVAQNSTLYSMRLQKRAALLFIPFLLNVPYSLEALRQPSRLLVEPGLLLSGGGPLSTLLGNPGGNASLPNWLISPILLVLVVSLFSSTYARRIAEYGVGALALAVVLSALTISTHGNEAAMRVWAGPVIVVVTLAAIAAGTVLLDRLRETLVLSHIHYRHILSALLLFTTLSYSVSAVAWSLTKGADSLVQADRETVMPAFLSVETDTKILVLREVGSEGDRRVQYYLSRGKDISLGEPDVAPRQNQAIAFAAQGLIDGTGVTSSSTLSDHGIKYLFVKAPFKKELVRSIDGLGGFSRTSATTLGVVWKVSAPASRLIFVGGDGVRRELEAGEVGARTLVPGPGTLILAETYSRSWQILENGFRLERGQNEQGLPTFTVTEAGEISLIHDGTIRRGWLSVQFIFLVFALVMALPAGRRKSEISEKVLA